MSSPHRISLLRAAVLLALLFGLGTGGAQPALAAPASQLARPGRASAAALPGTVSTEVQRATGYSPSQLSTRAACGSAPAGAYRCYARVLTLKSTGEAAAPLHVHALEAAGTATSAPAAYTSAFLQSAYDTTWLSANRGA
ncbi:MAG TPA: hypothetical protein VG293_08650, partial [Solirubrobacteraceae bacterium]|nr:hypothetical protein [Solirubrobacteraceae bacterium]